MYICCCVYLNKVARFQGEQHKQCLHGRIFHYSFFVLQNDEKKILPEFRMVKSAEMVGGKRKSGAPPHQADSNGASVAPAEPPVAKRAKKFDDIDPENTTFTFKTNKRYVHGICTVVMA